MGPNNAGEADRALGQLALDQAALQMMELELEMQLARVRETFRPKLAELQEKVTSGSAEIFAYAARVETNLALVHGQVRVTSSPAHLEHDEDEEAILQRLINDRPGLVSWRATLDKGAIRRLPADEIARLGLRLVPARQVEIKLATGVRLTRDLP